MNHIARLRAFALVLCVVPSIFCQQALRGITPEDYFSFEFLSDPHLSPDGRLAAYVVTKVDRAQNRRNSSIWLVATDGTTAPRQFTTSPQSTSYPRRNTDGQQLAFHSNRPRAEKTPSKQIHSQVYLQSIYSLKERRDTNPKNRGSGSQKPPNRT